MVQGSAFKYNAIKETEENTHLLNREDHDHIDTIMPSSNSTNDDTENQCVSVLHLELLHIYLNFAILTHFFY